MEGESLALLSQSPDPQQFPQPPAIPSAMLPAAPAHPSCDPLSCAPIPVQGLREQLKAKGRRKELRGAAGGRSHRGRALAVLGRGVPQ